MAEQYSAVCTNPSSLAIHLLTDTARRPPDLGCRNQRCNGPMMSLYLQGGVLGLCGNAQVWHYRVLLGSHRRAEPSPGDVVRHIGTTVYGVREGPDLPRSAQPAV